MRLPEINLIRKLVTATSNTQKKGEAESINLNIHLGRNFHLFILKPCMLLVRGSRL